MLLNFLKGSALFLGALLISRFAGLPANFTPILAAAVFAPTMINNRYLQILPPLAVMFISDIVLGFYQVMPVVYGCIALASVFGSQIKNIYVAGTTSVVAWHLIVNGAVWFTGHSDLGLMQTYLQAIPFDVRLLASTLLFVALFDATQRTAKALNGTYQTN